MPIGVSNLCKFHAQSRSGGQLVPSTIATQLNFKQSCSWAWKKCSNATFSRSMSSFLFAPSVSTLTLTARKRKTTKTMMTMTLPAMPSTSKWNTAWTRPPSIAFTLPSRCCPALSVVLTFLLHGCWWSPKTQVHRMSTTVVALWLITRAFSPCQNTPASLASRTWMSRACASATRHSANWSQTHACHLTTPRKNSSWLKQPAIRKLFFAAWRSRQKRWNWSSSAFFSSFNASAPMPVRKLVTASGMKKRTAPPHTSWLNSKRTLLMPRSPLLTGSSQVWKCSKTMKTKTTTKKKLVPWGNWPGKMHPSSPKEDWMMLPKSINLNTASSQLRTASCWQNTADSWLSLSTANCEIMQAQKITLSAQQTVGSGSAQKTAGSAQQKTSSAQQVAGSAQKIVISAQKIAISAQKNVVSAWKTAGSINLNTASSQLRTASCWQSTADSQLSLSTVNCGIMQAQKITLSAQQTIGSGSAQKTAGSAQ